MKQLLIYIFYTILIYAAIVVMPAQIIWTCMFIVGAMLIAMYEWLSNELEIV